MWPEAKDKPGIPQHDMQSMITGDENVQVRRKNKIAVSMKWTIPLVVATNVLVKWDDARGAMTRRLAIVPFDTPIDHVDTTLSGRLKRERLPFFVLTNAMFCNMLIQYKDHSIWGMDGDARIVGDAMWAAREEARKSLDICLRFLREYTKLEFDQDHDDVGRVISKAEFMEHFNIWKLEVGLERQPWVFKQDNISTAFDDCGLSYVKAYEHEVGSGQHPVEAILGVSLVADA